MLSKIKYYIVGFVSILVISYFMNQWKNMFNADDSNELIQKHLLNGTEQSGVLDGLTPLFTDSKTNQQSKPILWIHNLYEVNARKWKSFYSRNTTDLNQPYIHLTIKTIINHCNDDFKICLIDDNTFSQLLPSWEINMALTPEPMKPRYRELGMLQLLYVYGGLVLPNSFVCLKNLKDFYLANTENGNPFVCEKLNRTNTPDKKPPAFVPDTYIMGVQGKTNDTILEYINYLKSALASPHFSSENEFVGTSSQWARKAIAQNKMNLVSGEYVGIKTQRYKKIVLEDLMEDDYLKLHNDAVGIYIPADEILNRPKYQWFAVLSSEQILNSNIIIAKYLMTSIVDSNTDYNENTRTKPSGSHI